jgi:hypothetical protein
MSTSTMPSGRQTATGGLFDAHGRLVPGDGEVVYSQVERRYFSLAQPAFTFSGVLAAVAKHLGIADLDRLISAAEFERRCEASRQAILSDPGLAGLFRGVHVPFVLLPATARADLGEELDAVLLPAVAAAYVEKLAGFEFRNYLNGQLAGSISVVPGVRYDRLVASHAKQVVTGWYFPGALAGYAIPEQRRVIRRLPEAVSLSGPLEAAMAFLGTPDILMRIDNYPSLLALSAVQPHDPRLFHFFEAYGWNLTYNQRSMVGAVSEYFSGGLTVCG